MILPGGGGHGLRPQSTRLDESPLQLAPICAPFSLSASFLTFRISNLVAFPQDTGHPGSIQSVQRQSTNSQHK